MVALKIKNDDTIFLKNRTLMSKKDGVDENRKYIIELIAPEQITEDYKFSIFSDTMFKTMFTNENRKKYSCKLLSYLLNLSYEELLSKLEFGKNELDKKYENSKGERADFVAYINHSAIDIEINCNDNIETLERNIEYMNRLYAKEIKRGKKYHYRQAIQININNFVYKGKEKVKYVCYLKDEDGEALTDKLIILNIYIPNLLKKWYTIGEENLTEEEKFLLTLVIPDVKVASKIGKGYEIMEEYVNEAVEVSKEDNLVERYSKEWELKDQGYREGKEEGIEEKKYEIARKMLDKKFDIETVMDITGLTKEQIEEAL